MKKRNSARILDFTSLSDLFMLLSVLFLIMYSINTLRTGAIALAEREERKKKIEEIRTQASIANFQNVKMAFSTNQKEARKLKKELENLQMLEEKALDIKKKQEKLLKLAIDREINIKKYRQIIERSLYSHYGLKKELARESIHKRENQKAANTYRFEAAAERQKAKQLEKEVYYYKGQEYAYFLEKLKKDKVLRDVLKNNREIKKSFRNKGQELANTKFALELKKSNNNLYKKQNSQLKRTVASLNQKLQSTSKKMSSFKDENDVLKVIYANWEKSLDQKKKYQSKISGYENKTQNLSSKLEIANRKMIAQAGWIAELVSQKYKSEQGYQREISSLKEKERVQSELIDRLKNRMAKLGINAEVDEKNGELVLNFQDVYFDFGSNVLKYGMKKEIKRFISAYAEALVGDNYLFSNLKEVEITGSASPTFKGKFVNPLYTDSEIMRKALNLNLNLSYKRAKSIFDYIFNNEELEFKHKDRLLSLMKVSGLGFLRGRLPAGQTLEKLGETEDFCIKFSCKHYQNVRISFKLK